MAGSDVHGRCGRRITGLDLWAPQTLVSKVIIRFHPECTALTKLTALERLPVTQLGVMQVGNVLDTMLACLTLTLVPGRGTRGPVIFPVKVVVTHEWRAVVLVKVRRGAHEPHGALEIRAGIVGPGAHEPETIMFIVGRDIRAALSAGERVETAGAAVGRGGVDRGVVEEHGTGVERHVEL